MSSAETAVRPTFIPVSSFLEAGSGPLKLELMAGKAGLSRHVREATINRPGLGLSGFLKHFAHRRVQVIGLAEHAYLASLDEGERAGRLREFFGMKIPCAVVTRGKKLFPEICDLAEEFRVPLMRTSMITKHFVNAATILTENLMAPRQKVQGTMVEIMGIGVLICGKAGMGKSEAALGLIRKGYALVADDITALRLDTSGAVIGTPIEVTRYHMEIRGLGIIHVPSLFGVASVRGDKRLDLVVKLCEPGAEDMTSVGMSDSCTILGVNFPQLCIPVAPGRDLTNVLEAAALDQKLRRLGHDAEKELDERLMNAMAGGMDGSE